MMKLKAQNKSQDSPWSWVVCGASFFVQFLVLGIQNSYGIMFVPLLDEFKSSELATAWIGTLSFSLMYFLGPLITVLCHQYTCRIVTCTGAVLGSVGLVLTSFVTQFSLLFVTYGILWGLGASMCYFGSLVVLNSYFKKRLSLAYGVALAGAGAGVPVMSVTLNNLAVHNGWRFSLRTISLAGIAIFACGLFFAPLPTLKQTTTECEQKNEYLLKKGSVKIWSKHPFRWDTVKKAYIVVADLSRLFLDVRIFAQNRALIAWTVGLCLILSGYFMPFVFLVRMASEVGVPASKSALLIGYQAITQTIFKVIFGILGDIKPTCRITLLQIAALVNAVNTTLCPLARGYAAFLGYVVVFGICDGCFAVMFSMGTHYIVGDKNMPVVFGKICSVVAIAQAFGTPLAGLIYDVYGEYNIAFFVSGGLTTLGICVMFLIPNLMPYYQQPKHERQELIISLKDTGQNTTRKIAPLKSLRQQRSTVPFVSQKNSEQNELFYDCKVDKCDDINRDLKINCVSKADTVCNETSSHCTSYERISSSSDCNDGDSDKQINQPQLFSSKQCKRRNYFSNHRVWYDFSTTRRQRPYDMYHQRRSLGNWFFSEEAHSSIYQKSLSSEDFSHERMLRVPQNQHSTPIKHPSVEASPKAGKLSLEKTTSYANTSKESPGIRSSTLLFEKGSTEKESKACNINSFGNSMPRLLEDRTFCTPYQNTCTSLLMEIMADVYAKQEDTGSSYDPWIKRNLQRVCGLDEVPIPAGETTGTLNNLNCKDTSVDKNDRGECSETSYMFLPQVYVESKETVI